METMLVKYNKEFKTVDEEGEEVVSYRDVVESFYVGDIGMVEIRWNDVVIYFIGEEKPKTISNGIITFR